MTRVKLDVVEIFSASSATKRTFRDGHRVTKMQRNAKYGFLPLVYEWPANLILNARHVVDRVSSVSHI